MTATIESDEKDEVDRIADEAVRKLCGIQPPGRYSMIVGFNVYSNELRINLWFNSVKIGRDIGDEGFMPRAVPVTVVVGNDQECTTAEFDLCDRWDEQEFRRRIREAIFQHTQKIALKLLRRIGATA